MMLGCCRGRRLRADVVACLAALDTQPLQVVAIPPQRFRGQPILESGGATRSRSRSEDVRRQCLVEDLVLEGWGWMVCGRVSVCVGGCVHGCACVNV